MVEPLVPHPPEPLEPVVVEHAPAHVVDHINPHHERPEPSHFPNHRELEPDEHEVEEAEIPELKKRHGWVWSDCMDEVVPNLKRNEECGDAKVLGFFVSRLRLKRVEALVGDGWAREEGWSEENVLAKVSEAGLG